MATRKILNASNKPYATEATAEAAGRELEFKYGFTVEPFNKGFAIVSNAKSDEEILPTEETDASAEQKLEERKTGKGSDDVTDVWAEDSLYSIPEKFKTKGYKYRFVSIEAPGRIQKVLSQGWEYAEDVASEMQKREKSLKDGKTVDGHYVIRDQVLMRLRDDHARNRDASMEEKNSGKSAAEMAAANNRDGAKAGIYGHDGT